MKVIKTCTSLLLFTLWANLVLAQNKNIPPDFSLENQRWFVPADRWHSISSYVQTGNFFTMTVGDLEKSPIKIYGSPNRGKKPEIFYTGIVDNPDKKIFCNQRTLHPEVEVNSFAECGFLACEEKKEKKAISEIPPNLDQGWVAYEKESFKEIGKCLWTLDMFTLSVENLPPQYNFKYLALDLKKGFATILVSGKKMYLDISQCNGTNLTQSGSCDTKEIKASILSTQWEFLNERKQKKDIAELNDLIAFLLPCVKSRNLACVRKYFITPQNFDSEVSPKLAKFNFSSLKFDDDLLRELESCLSYDKLLPHMLGTKGIKKVCLFNRYMFSKNPLPPKGNSKMINVVYPEAVRESVDSDEVIDVKIE